MKITGVRWQCYRVPFRRPFVTARGVERVREGLLIQIQTDVATSGIGEAAPLPSFGGGMIADVERSIRAVSPQITGIDIEDALRLIPAIVRDFRGRAALRFGIETAVLDARCKSEDMSLAAHLNPLRVHAVPVNATISSPSVPEAVDAASDAIRSGFSAIKLKVGLDSDPGREVERVSAVREAIGKEIELRLDANGAWTASEAIDRIRRLARFDVAYVEQPTPPGNIETLATVRRSVDVPVAADEAALSARAIDEIIRRAAADVVIIKPAMVGGLISARELIERAHQAGVRTVVTTALEAGVATAAALHLASTLPAPVPACGLATTGLLERDLLTRPLAIEDGMMPLPGGTGLGVTLATEIAWT